MLRLVLATALVFVAVPALGGSFEWRPNPTITPCNGFDYGTEMSSTPLPTPPAGQVALVPLPAHVQAQLPIAILRTHLRLYFNGPVTNGMYAGISANTDRGLVWWQAGCNVNNQTCPFTATPTDADLGALLFYLGVDPVKTHHFEMYPPVISAGDGLVISMVCTGGGQFQPVIDFDFVPVSQLVTPPS